MYGDVLANIYEISKIFMSVTGISGEKVYIDWVEEQTELLFKITQISLCGNTANSAIREARRYFGVLFLLASIKATYPESE